MPSPRCSPTTRSTQGATGSVNGQPCDARTLSNFATPAIDSLAEARRLESRSAAGILGLPEPEFLGYPDTGIAAASANAANDEHAKMLHRSDFSDCENCAQCQAGWGSGPATALSADTLTGSLDRLLSESPDNTLIATTHWLDSHPDHAALGTFVSERAAAATSGRTVAFAVIHANTRNGYATSECWYPGPAAADCSCFNEDLADADADWLASVNAHRLQPDWPMTLPDDVDYGQPVQLCIDEATRLAKPAAIAAFETQLGTVGREPGILPESREGLLDCSGYLRSFGRRTEVFVVRKFP